jgi:hypothetical protein
MRILTQYTTGYDWILLHIREGFGVEHFEVTLRVNPYLTFRERNNIVTLYGSKSNPTRINNMNRWEFL